MVLALFGVALGAHASEATALARWFPVSQRDAATAPPTITNATFGLEGITGGHSTVWAVFDPMPLVSGRSVTLSCRLRLPDDFPRSVGDDIRIGLYGTLAGVDPKTTRQDDLRGFALLAGAEDRFWTVRLSEHATAGGPLIQYAGLKAHQSAKSEATGGRGTMARIVITLTKKSADRIQCHGFWGDAPFSFEFKPYAGDYTHLRAVAILRGGRSGVAPLAIANVKVQQD
jgi:hypothetical protein